jgi:hypothetical protein
MVTAGKDVLGIATEGRSGTMKQRHSLMVMGTIASAWNRPVDEGTDVEEVRLMGDLKIPIPPKRGRTDGMSVAIMVTRTDAESTDRMIARYTTIPWNRTIPLAIGTRKKQPRALLCAVVMSRNNHTTASSATRIPLQRWRRRRR